MGVRESAGTSAVAALIALGFVLLLPANTSAQAKPTAAAGAITPEQANRLASGWAALAKGDAAAAENVVQQALAEDPSNAAAFALALEIAISRGGWQRGLDTYERWQSQRRIEQAYGLRRVARSALYDAIRTGDPQLRAEAARALTAGGERDVPALLKRWVTASFHDTMTMAAVGDPEAIASVSESLRAGTGDRLAAIRALTASGSDQAIAPLTTALASPRPELVAAAAEGLGRLGARAAIPQLTKLLSDPVPATRLAAAAGLNAMNEPAGQTVLRDALKSDFGALRLVAARALAGGSDTAWQAAARTLLADPDPSVQAGAAELVASFDPDASRQTLARLAQDTNPAIRELAQRSLPTALNDDFPTLRAMMRAADRLVHIRAAGHIFALTR